MILESIKDKWKAMLSKKICEYLIFLVWNLLIIATFLQ